MLDVRKPIGYLFAIYGAILIVWGVIHPVQTALAGHNLSVNLNLCWGACMGVFGVFMLSLAFFDHKREK